MIKVGFEDIDSSLTNSQLRASAIDVQTQVPVPVSDNEGSLTVDGNVNIILGQSGVDGGSGVVSSKTIRTVLASSDPNTLFCASATSAGTLITIPANKKWRGTIAVSGSITAGLNTAATNGNVRITFNPGTGGTTSFTPCQAMVATPLIGLTSLIGISSSNQCVVTDIEVYSGTTSASFSLIQTNMTQYFGMVAGIIMD